MTNPLFLLEPETAHHLAAFGLRALVSLPGVEALLTAWTRVADPVELLGLTFPNRVGLAAGFDKEAQLVRAASALGFGHVEVGTLTPRAQPGHPRPRVWRLVAERSLRNRMGFPNDGAAAAALRLRRQQPYPIPVGVNLGKAHDTPLDEAWRDYCEGLARVFPLADYVAVNLSSPNTAGLRSLSVAAILEPVEATNARLAAETGLPRRPLLVKLSPDVEEPEALARVLLDLPVDGVIATNTTARRLGAFTGVPPEGGLSGGALTLRSREVVARLRAALGPRLPLVGVGGVLTPEDATALLEAGADLVQVYTGFVFGGPTFPHRVARALAGRCAREGRERTAPW